MRTNSLGYEDHSWTTFGAEIILTQTMFSKGLQGVINSTHRFKHIANSFIEWKFFLFKMSLRFILKIYNLELRNLLQ